MRHFLARRQRSSITLARTGTTGALTVALITLGAGLAFATAPSISVKAPRTLATGAKYTLKVSGYFNCTGTHTKCGNVASVEEYKGTFKCTKKTIHHHHGTFVAGGPSDKQMRAKTPNTPGHFSAKEKVQAPQAGGRYTLCGFLLNYPTGYIPKQHMATAHVTVKAPAPTKHTLTVTVTGGGDVFSADGGISCQGGDTCTHAYAIGATVKLSAVAGDGRMFLGWSGACSGTAKTCDVTMSANESVTAKFSTGGFAR